MIDFVLQNAGVPARGFDSFFGAMFIEAIDADGARARDERGVAGQAKAALKENDGGIGRKDDLGIYQDVKGDGAALAFGEHLGRSVFQELLAVLDYGKLDRETYLGSGEADAGRVMHRLAHIDDETLDFFAGDFFCRKRSGRLTQDRITDLNYL